MATNRKISLPASAVVCSVSASRAGEPVSAAATPLATAIARLAESGAITLPKLSSRPGAAGAALIPPGSKALDHGACAERGALGGRPSVHARGHRVTGKADRGR